MAPCSDDQMAGDSDPSSWTWQEVQFRLACLAGTDISTWVDVEMDIKVDLTNSCPDMDGNFGNFYFVGQSWSDSPGWNQFAGTTISTNAGTGWQHIKTSLASLPSRGSESARARYQLAALHQQHAGHVLLD